MEVERFSHIHMCFHVVRIFDWFVGLARSYHPGMQNTPALRVLGVWNMGVLDGTLSDLHIIVWKFIIIHFTAVDTDGQRFIDSQVWKAAVLRQQGRVEAHGEKVRRKIQWSDGQLDRKELDRLTREVSPLVDSYSDDGEQVLSEPWNDLVDMLNSERALG